MNRRYLLLVLAAALAVTLAGCAASVLLAYLGGGLPPGDGDIGGVVLASADTAAAATTLQSATTPVVGAEVALFRGQTEVGRTLTGPEGYFRFEKPDTGNYMVRVRPPSGSGLLGAERQFQHRQGQQSFLTIVLDQVP